MAGMNDQAKKRWEDLARSESATLDRIVQGKASRGDIDRISKLLVQYSKLAGDVFKRGVAVMERDAKTRVNAAISEQGGTVTETQRASLTQEALNEVYSKQGKELLEAVKELFVETSNESTNTLGSYMDDHFKEADTKYSGYHSDVVKAIQKLEATERRREATPPNTAGSVLDAEAELVNESGRDAQVGDLPPGSSSGGEHVENAKDEPPVPEDDSSLDLPIPLPVDINNVEDLNSKSDRENWAKSWWRNMRNFMAGRVRPKSLLAELAGLTGLAYIFSPAFRDWIDEKLDGIKGYLSISKITETLKSVWEWIEEQGTRLVKLVVDSLDDAVQWVSKKATASKEAVTNSVDAVRLGVTVSGLESDLATTESSISAAKQGLQRLYDMRDGKLPLPPKYRANPNRLANEIEAKETSLARMIAERDKTATELARVQVEHQAAKTNAVNAAKQTFGTDTDSTTASAETTAATPMPAQPVTTNAVPSVNVDAAAEPPPPATQATPQGNQQPGQAGNGYGASAGGTDGFSYTPGVGDKLAIAATL